MDAYVQIITQAIRKRNMPFGISLSEHVIVTRIDHGTFTIRPIFILSKKVIDCYVTYPYELRDVDSQRVVSIIRQENQELPFGELEVNERIDQLSFFSEYFIPETPTDTDRLSLELLLNYFLDKVPGILANTLSLITDGEVAPSKKQSGINESDILLALANLETNKSGGKSGGK